MIEMRFEKHREAETWHALGLMGNTLSYTDEDIITSQALGYTKQTVGVSNPMDIAVLYSIVNEGEGVELTAKDMVNEYTRLAYLFEEGIIVDGYINVDNIIDCGGFKNKLRNIDYWSGGKYLSRASYIIRDLNKLQAYDLIEKYAQLLCGWDSNDEYHNTWERERDKLLADIVDYPCPKDYGMNSVDVNATKLKNNLKNNLTSYGVNSGAYGSEVRLDNGWVVKSYGICKDSTPDVPCKTHKVHDIRKDAWVHRKDYSVLKSSNRPTGKYGGFKKHLKMVVADTVEYDKEANRDYTKIVDEKVLLRTINKSLNRMMKRGVIVQTTYGRGRKFKWYDSVWQKVQAQRMKIMTSNSKKRKLGDVVNGWEYYKMKITESFGMEIVEYGWRPKEELNYYYIKMSNKKILSRTNWNKQGAPIDYYLGNGGNLSLHWIFYDSASAHTYKNTLQELMDNATVENGINKFNTIDENFDTNIISPQFSVMKVEGKYRLNADADVESLPTPFATMKKHHLVGHKFFDDKDYFAKQSTTITLTVKEEKKEASE